MQPGPAAFRHRRYHGDQRRVPWQRGPLRRLQPSRLQVDIGSRAASQSPQQSTKPPPSSDHRPVLRSPFQPLYQRHHHQRHQHPRFSYSSFPISAAAAAAAASISRPSPSLSSSSDGCDGRPGLLLPLLVLLQPMPASEGDRSSAADDDRRTIVTDDQLGCITTRRFYHRLSVSVPLCLPLYASARVSTCPFVRSSLSTWLYFCPCKSVCTSTRSSNQTTL